jgi:hypothetical protein
MKKIKANSLQFGFEAATWVLEINDVLFHIDSTKESLYIPDGYIVIKEANYGDYILSSASLWQPMQDGSIIELHNEYEVIFDTLWRAKANFYYREQNRLIKHGLV